MKRTFFTLAFGLWAFALVTAQMSQIYSHDNKTYQDALALYNNEQFQAAQTLFEQVGTQTSDAETKANCAYYSANAAIRLGQRGADGLMEKFVENHPTSTKRNSAFIDVGDYYFDTGKYPYAIKWYQKVDEFAMSKKDRERFHFNNGYAYYQSDKPKEAERYLKKVSNSTEYGSQAKYYLGFIAYEQDDYEAANESFDKITDPKILEEKMAYYQADLNFKSGNFEKAIAMAEQHMPKADRREQSELNKIIGESYFNLGRYEEAIPYLQQYQGKRGRFSNTDFYLLGYSYYQLKNYEEAIGQFNKIIDGNNSVAQNAYYHLAECYLKLNKKPEALNAFRNASQMNFSAEIEKDAFLNYARLSYEIGNAYEPVPQVMTAYLEKYPKDEHQKEIQNLLVDSYITSRNFSGAMELLEANADYATEETYQKVAFYNGLEQFVNSDYEAAIESFSKSLKRAKNPVVEARAGYWMAESGFRLNRFEAALEGFKKLEGNASAKSTDEYQNLDYQLGYCYFKLKEYAAAIPYFKKVTVALNMSQEMVTDSYMRMADGYFVTNKFKEAIAAYDRASNFNGPERDYAAFQKAICQGFLGNNAKKIAGLDQFLNTYPQSSYRDDALFELGNTYVKADNTVRAQEIYDQLIGTYGKSKFAPRAMLRQGLLYYNENNNGQALAKFKNVVADYPNTPEANQAVAQAKLVYIDLGKVSDYAAWVRTLDFVEVTDAELETASYEAAERKNIEGKTDAAIKGYEDYLTQFPNGVEALNVNFKLAQLYLGKGEKQKALNRYQIVAASEGGDYTEQALTRVCEILIGDQDYGRAMPYLLQLENDAEIEQNRTFAQSNLMKGYYEQKDYQNTLAYAQKVLNAPKIDNRIKSDAQLMIARSAIATGDERLAESAFAEVLKIATGETAAEAWYYDAYFKNQKGAFESSNLSVQKLAKEYSAYKQWGGKGLILMAKNFDSLNDAFQATYILESVIENFTDFPELVAEAQTELNLIKSREAETNSSVDPNGQ